MGRTAFPSMRGLRRASATTRCGSYQFHAMNAECNNLMLHGLPKGLLRGVLFVACLMPFRVAPAQSAMQPVLHRRSEAVSRRPQANAIHGRSSSSLPEEASGEYQLGESGEIIEIILQAGQLDGYISRNGDTESDRGTPLTFFFDRTSVSARRLNFTTWQVHGIWFSFEGTIVRGPGRSREEESFYLLEGELVGHDTVERTEQRRSVSLKLSGEAEGN